MQEAQDFLAESRTLHQLLARGNSAAFERRTQFKDWAVNDVIRHLHFWNEMAELQVRDENELLARLGRVAGWNGTLCAFERDFIGDIAGPELLAVWIAQAERTALAYQDIAPKTRLKWAGPEMSARSSMTARHMETWAHGQEVFDLFGAVRTAEDRIRNIVVLGINTFEWTYRVRGEDVPSTKPFVALTAPSGMLWEFGDSALTERVEGAAEDFCHVVAQTRNVADTTLRTYGAIAADWMSKAQCFAGPPAPPPAPGTRFVTAG